MALLLASLRNGTAMAWRSTAVATEAGWARFQTSDAIVRHAEENKGNEITEQGAAFIGDLRSTSGLGTGDGIQDHTGKWLQGDYKSPMEYVHEQEPIEVHGLTVASMGADDPALGAPVEYIDLRGTTRDNPATCKYTGNKYYSEDWKYPGRASH